MRDDRPLAEHSKPRYDILPASTVIDLTHFAALREESCGKAAKRSFACHRPCFAMKGLVWTIGHLFACKKSYFVLFSKFNLMEL